MCKKEKKYKKKKKKINFIKKIKKNLFLNYSPSRDGSLFDRGLVDLLGPPFWSLFSSDLFDYSTIYIYIDVK